MKILFSILSVCFFVSIVSCKKDKEVAPEKYCWQIIDALGNNINQICDKTEEELRGCIKSNSCGITSSASGFTLDCGYYRVDGEKFCWQIGAYNLNDANEYQAKLFGRCFLGGAIPVKTTCIPCQRWYTRDKMTYKPNNTTTYTQIRVGNYCGDTLTKIYQGRQIIKKDDADSLIVLQFSNNGTNW
jgi:hypothetical protein